MKIGLAGLGVRGEMHLKAYRNLPKVAIAAVYPGDSLSVVTSPRSYEDWRSLVDDPEIDILDICLASDLHASVALAALAAGKHVISAAPMALSAEDCERMVAASQKHDRVLMIGHVLRFQPEYIHLKKFAEGAIYGAVRSITFTRRSGWPVSEQSGGAALELLIEEVDQALDLFGLPSRVAAKSIAGPGTVMATLIYPGGPEVRIQGGWFAPGTTLSMSFQARAARAELEWTPTGLMLSDQAGQRKKVDLPDDDPYAAELSYFVDCCRLGAQPVRCPPHASAVAVKTALAIIESQQAGGQPVLLTSA